MEITLNDIRAWYTPVMLFTFLGIVFWAYSRKRRPSFDEAANLPFADHELDVQSVRELQAEEASKNQEKLS